MFISGPIVPFLSKRNTYSQRRFLTGRTPSIHRWAQSTCRTGQNGWTLIELLTVLAVVSILAGVGVPSLSKWFQRQSEASLFKTLYHLSSYARTKAIRERQFLTLCPSEDHRQCNGEWQDTIIIFSDGNRNETLDSDEQLYKAITLPDNTPCLQWRASAGRNYLQFKPSGVTNGTAGHFRFCDQVISNYNKQLVVSFSGRSSLRDL